MAKKGKKSKIAKKGQYNKDPVSTDVEMTDAPNGSVASWVPRYEEDHSNTPHNSGNEDNYKSQETLDSAVDMVEESKDSSDSDDDPDPRGEDGGSMPGYRIPLEPNRPRPDDFNPSYGFDIHRESEARVDAEDPDEELRNVAAENGTLLPPLDDPVADLHDSPARTVEEMKVDKDIWNLHYQYKAGPLALFRRRLRAAGYGEVTLPSSYAGDLDIEIHPIFRQEHWFLEDHFGPDNVAENDILWQRMQPSLRLASMLITNPNSMDWWVRLLHGKQVVDKATGNRYLTEPEDQGFDGIARVAAMFTSMSTRVRFSFSDNMLGHAGLAFDDWQSLVDWCNETCPELRPPTDTRRRYRLPSGVRPVLLSINFKKYFLSEQYAADGSSCTTMSTNWFFATTIVHELAHQFWIRLRARSTWEEPFFNKDDGYNELGISWGSSVYGDGFLFGQPHETYGLLGLCMEPNFRSRVDKAIMDNTLFKYPLDPLWMYSFFMKKTWQEFNQLSGMRKTTFWHSPVPRVAIFQGPQRRFDDDENWLWLSSEYPDTHRLSIQYWWDRMNDAIKRRDERKRYRKSKSRAAQQDSEYQPHRR